VSSANVTLSVVFGIVVLAVLAAGWIFGPRIRKSKEEAHDFSSDDTMPGPD